MADEKKPASKPAADSGEAEVQKQADAEQDKGYVGRETDPTPNENYTVKGVISGKPTPETDPEYAEKIRKERQANL